jgi:hypothetical protein
MVEDVLILVIIVVGVAIIIDMFDKKDYHP